MGKQLVMEHLRYWDYAKQVAVQSKIDPEATLYVPDGMVCPHCKRKLEAMEQDSTQTCPDCGLVMSRLASGTSLFCTLAIETIHP